MHCVSALVLEAMQEENKQSFDCQSMSVPVKAITCGCKIIRLVLKRFEEVWRDDRAPTSCTGNISVISENIILQGKKNNPDTNALRILSVSSWLIISFQ